MKRSRKGIWDSTKHGIEPGLVNVPHKRTRILMNRMLEPGAGTHDDNSIVWSLRVEATIFNGIPTLPKNLKIVL